MIHHLLFGGDRELAEAVIGSLSGLVFGLLILWASIRWRW